MASTEQRPAGSELVSTGDELNLSHGAACDGPSFKKRTISDAAARAEKRVHGKAFTTKGGNNHPEKALKPNPYHGKCGKNAQKFQKKIGSFYAASSKTEQDALLSRTITLVNIKRRRSAGSERKAVEYSVPSLTGQERTVCCKRFLMATLDVTVGQLRALTKNMRGGHLLRKKNSIPRHTLCHRRKEKAYAWIGTSLW